MLLFSLAFSLSAQFEGEQGEGGESPGTQTLTKEESDIAAYQMGVQALRRIEYQKARRYFQQSIAKGGEFADKARLELVQLMAMKDTKGNDLKSIRKLLHSFQDQKIGAEAWIKAAQTLAQNLRFEEALGLAQELHLRFPNSGYADEALLLAAHILYYERNSPVSALERLYTCLRLYPRTNAKMKLYGLFAKIYMDSNSNFYNVSRFCRFQRLYNMEKEKLGLSSQEDISALGENTNNLCEP